MYSVLRFEEYYYWSDQSLTVFFKQVFLFSIENAGLRHKMKHEKLTKIMIKRHLFSFQSILNVFSFSASFQTIYLHFIKLQSILHLYAIMFPLTAARFKISRQMEQMFSLAGLNAILSILSAY